jgi:hypothetical protein
VTELKKGTLPMAAESPGVVTVSVYDPAMCCPTGVCGPSVDPELTRISQDLRWVESRGARVERFNLAQEPDAFVANPRVTGLMQAFGDGALPAVLVNGEVAAHGRYPTREEILEAVKAPVGAGETSDASGSSCCEPGSGCC